MQRPSPCAVQTTQRHDSLASGEKSGNASVVTVELCVALVPSAVAAAVESCSGWSKLGFLASHVEEEEEEEEEKNKEEKEEEENES